MRGPSDIVFVQPDHAVDHLPGVREELAARGLTSARQDEPHAPPRVYPRTKLVVVTDLIAPRCRAALRQASAVGSRTALLMDGITEFRNTAVNPRVPDSFLRPAPVDAVLCSGLSDARVLRSLGNRGIATGLPRIDRAAGYVCGPAPTRRLLVATANTPWFDDDERRRLVQAVSELGEALDRSRWEVVWRLRGGLDDELGVRSDARPLHETLGDVSAVLTTPSTLMVEAMRAGLPTALLRVHAEPLWHAAAWVLEPDGGPRSMTEPADGRVSAVLGSVPGPAQGLMRWVDSPERLLRQLERPTREQLERQAECLRWLDASSGDVAAAELVADAIAREAASPAPEACRLVPPVAKLPEPEPRLSGRRRVVSIVAFDGSPVGGVTTFSRRLGEAFDAEGSGYDLRTLLVAWDAASAHRAAPLLDDGRTSLCVIDRSQPVLRIVDHLRAAVERLSPDIVLPNYTDASAMVAGQLRFAGVRSVGIGHTDDDAYRELLLQTEWDGAVAVSESIRAWLGPLAADRPCETIVYGVPVSDRPREVPSAGPMKIAYIGRVVQAQKRVLDLVPVLSRLSALGVSARLHIVGEGDAEAPLRAAMRSTPMPGIETVFHGPKSEAELRRMLPTFDVSLLVSDAEGTSISMLEAMGAGVVPAVTRVASGADDWVEDGVSGVSAPVGDPCAMAARLAWLAGDRDRLRRLGEEAHRRVASTQTIGHMASRYASLFDRVMQRPIDAQPSMVGLSIIEPMRWIESATDDPAGERAIAERWLREAGFASVAFEPGAPGEALYLDVERADEADVWPGGLERSVERPVVRGGSGVLQSELVPHVARLAREGFERIAICGLGRHTQRRCGVFEDAQLPVVGIIDDEPPASGEAFGFPVLTCEEALATLRPDAVLISSDTWEAELFERTASLREAGVAVHLLYSRAAQAAVV